jgi:flagellar biosynthesis/type III secretory pathway chaperone
MSQMKEIKTNMLQFRCECGCIEFYVVGEKEIFICTCCRKAYNHNGKLLDEDIEKEELKKQLELYKKECVESLAREERLRSTYAGIERDYEHLKERMQKIRKYALNAWEEYTTVPEPMGR